MTKLLEVAAYDSGELLGKQWWWKAVIEAPIQIDLTSLWNTCKVFDNLHMQWMCIWMSPYHITAAFGDKAVGSRRLEFWVTPWQAMTVKSGDWGCSPNPDWSHIIVKHMQGVWQPSYAMDVHMDASLPHYSSDRWPSFWKLPRILGNSLARNDGEKRWLRL